MGPLTPLNKVRFNLDELDKLNKQFNETEVDFNPANYTEDQLHKIQLLIDDELQNIRDRDRDIQLIDLKTKYEGRWIKDINSNNLYFIIKFNSPCEFEYIYVVKNVEERSGIIGDYDYRFSMGKTVGQFDFLSCFRYIQVIESHDELEQLIGNISEEIKNLLNVEIKDE